MTTTPISLTPLSPAEAGKITQLYRFLELFSEGSPPRHSLFIFAPGDGLLDLGNDSANEDQLLIIDPPADVSQRFRLGNQVAALFTGEPEQSAIPVLQTIAGGIAHLRIGDHFLDIHSQKHGSIVQLPASGVICGGEFGSDSTIPRSAAGSDGSDELETLRLLARLVKQGRLSLYIPHIGTESTDKVVVMERLAGDVAYLHALRRAVTPLALAGESVDAVFDQVEKLLPQARHTPDGLTTHRHNVGAMMQAVVPSS